MSSETTSMSKSVSIVVPVYYNETNLPDTVPQLMELANSFQSIGRLVSLMMVLATDRWRCYSIIKNIPKISL